MRGEVKNAIRFLIKKQPWLHRVLVDFWCVRWPAVRRHAELVCIYFTKRNVIYHLGVYGVGGNAGDDVLYRELENVADSIVGKPLLWHHRFIGGEVSRLEVAVINRVARAVVVGGHGLMMVDTHKNANSGWQFNITIQNLERLQVPLVIAAVGYNVFRGQGDFQSIFNRHIARCVEKSVFFGLRNYGSMQAVKSHLPVALHDKVSFQPCPTTLIRHYYPERAPSHPSNEQKVGICLAFDRLQNRFGGRHYEIFDDIAHYAHWLKTVMNLDARFFVHTAYDLKQSELCSFFSEKGWPLVSISGFSVSEIYQYYRQYSLVVGMRGHSLMIPFGLGVPVLSITTQNKQRWFIETLNHDEWSIEATDPKLLKLLKAQTLQILESLDLVRVDLQKMQRLFVETTEKNIQSIREHVAPHCRATKR
jgi:hypothetical protein